MPRPALTHFLSIPLCTTLSAPHLNASLGRFAADVTDPTFGAAADPVDTDQRTASTSPSAAIRSKGLLPPDALSPPSSLHLTLGVMSLNDPGRIEEAAAFLNTLDMRAMLEAAALAAEARSEKRGDRSSRGNTVAGANGLTVKLQGLRSMGSPEETTVLYAVPYDHSGRLWPLCEALRTAFMDAGFVVRENRPLKLHATVMNTTNVRNNAPRTTEGSGSRGGKRNDRLKIDATELIERWRSTMWARVKIEKVAICEMGKKKGDDGLFRYREVAELGIPAL
ncbi:kinase A anchor protein [Mortierella sp. GBAus27b]|nr:hypothetical protein BGX31_010622 [Mortierella sp. GBA43]KAI8346973.1 kinase A anchor protein [Mortierella sp. GBAus27b]